MWIKNIILLIFILFLLNNVVHGEANNSNQNQSGLINSSTPFISTGENKVYAANQLNDMSLEQEREFLAQKQKTYDTFLTMIILVLTLFGVFLTIVLALIGFWSYKNIRELKNEMQSELDKGLSSAQTIIEKTMKSVNEKPISDLSDRVNKLENRVEDIKRAIDKGQKKLPEYYEDKEIVQVKNIFEEE